MQAWENLITYISGRGATFGTTPKGGHFARFENELYFHPLRFGSYFIWNNVPQLRFYLFYGSGDAHVAPSFDSLGELLSPRMLMAYKVWNPKGVRARPEIRTVLQEKKQRFGWRQPQVSFYWTPESSRLPTWAPRSWSEIRFLILPNRKAGPGGYDWSVQGSAILDSLEFLIELAELTRMASRATD